MVHVIESLGTTDGWTWLWFDRFDGPQIDETRFVRLASEDRIKLSPAMRLHLTFEGGAYFVFRLGPELHGHAILRSGANTAADVNPADHQIAAVLCLAADQKMHVRIVGIVVVNRTPVELGAEISLHVGDQLPREGP
jgi:hypothetical protein